LALESALITCSPSVFFFVVAEVRVCKELSFLGGGKVSYVRVIQLVGGAGDVVLESSEVQMDALITGVAVLTASGLDNDPLQKHRARRSRTLMALRVTVGATSGAVGGYRAFLRVIILTSWFALVGRGAGVAVVAVGVDSG